MHKMVNKVSADNTLYFTPNQLYAACYRKESLLARGFLFVGLPLFLFLIGSLMYPWWLILPIILLVWWWSFRSDYKEPLRSQISEDSLNKALKRWAQRRHINLPKGTRGEPLKLIDARQLKQAPKASTEKDLYDYGVEAVIVTDQDIYVDLFVKNGYHTQYKALIISKNLYPKYLKPHLTRVLQEKPDLPLFFIHDATDAGQQTMAHFKQIDGLAVEGHPCIDLGVTLEHFKKLKPLKKFYNISNLEAPLDYLQHRHFTAIFNKYIVERAKRQGLLSDEERMISEAEGLTNQMLMVDLVADDFG
jgi:hypothetical protein